MAVFAVIGIGCSFGKQMKDHLNLPFFVNANQSNVPIYDIAFNPDMMKYEIEFTEENYITDMN